MALRTTASIGPEVFKLSQVPADEILAIQVQRLIDKTDALERRITVLESSWWERSRQALRRLWSRMFHGTR